MTFPELTGKVVFVTGACQGIGEAVAKTFLNEGSIVVGADLAFDNNDLIKVSDNSYQIHVNVADESSVQNVVAELEKAGLVPNVLAHVAGISTMDYLVNSKTSDFDKTIAVNTKGTYLIAKNIVNLMLTKEQPAKVIFMASQAGKNGYRAMAAYSASKHAVLGLTKTLAIELASKQINVNAVCPGIIETAMKHRERRDGAKIRGLNPDDIEKEDNSQVPLGRTGTPQDVANVVLFLSSHLSDYMTGQALNVTGGMTMN
ncbi:SDR family NAD(P)-dependent oxidoreductase [Companilactobacillus ginsenosidimutans]|uniref:Oxidoreductase n=1 Tax=Companilactobacillus ginsenosidimutans TaxID=1007676 RepID=A0A0H4QJT7_9LACO|nr:SDR family NAD(P)-dependent oxidoreductase [Companilactobacillus ginsenosidimutans]AKP68177.1 oxidoreductase [Companilactobacillus ginsenosidimutans]